MPGALMTVTIEDARLVFKNFAGKESQFNREGDRNFGVILSPDVAQAMMSDGWNVKFLKVREEDRGEEPTPWLPVAVGFKNRPPKIVMITSSSRVGISESMVETLDQVDMALVDLIVRSYAWEANGKTGIKAYLQTMFVTINEDDLEKKYGVKAEDIQGDDD